LDFSGKKQFHKIEFNTKTLPPGELLDIENPEHKTYVDYLLKRKINLEDYSFVVTPDDLGRNKNRIVIPYTYKNEIVGNTSRYLDNKIPKFINDQQPGYVFNIDKQHKDWSVCVVTEGIFDALSIDGVALMHNDISTDQVIMLSQLNKQIIVVPDRDTTGLKICDKALELGYQVSLPDWDTDIKDVNDAVIRYGKLPTLLSIIQNKTNSKIKIEMQRRKIAKGI
jgi:DNA primase